MKEKDLPLFVLVPLLLGGFGGFFLCSSLNPPASKSDLQASTAQINQQIQQAQGQLSTLNQNIASVNQNTQNLDSRLSNLENSVSGIDNKVSNTNTALNNILIYSITLAIVFSLVFNLSWKLIENQVQIKNDFGGIIAGLAIAAIIFVIFLILGTVKLAI